jgi:hypothetical protein
MMIPQSFHPKSCTSSPERIFRLLLCYEKDPTICIPLFDLSVKLNFFFLQILKIDSNFEISIILDHKGCTKLRNEIETQRTKQNETKRNEMKYYETQRNILKCETKRKYPKIQ